MVFALLGAAGVPTIVPGVTITELKADAGGVGQTRTIVDPTYPNANGTVTWVASDPLTGTDPGGKSRDWARYTDGSGGFWRRDDWNALTVGVGAANAISLDWIGIDDGEDISIAFQELWDQYIDGSEGNVLSIKGPEDVASFAVGGLAITGDGSASAWYWYKPTTRKAICYTKPYDLGTEDLIDKTWSNLGSNRWSTTVTENVADLRTADPSISGPGSVGPWLHPASNVASALSVNSAREWHYDGGTNTLTVYATSDPSTYFATGSSSSDAGMIYYTDVTNHDYHGTLTNVHKIYIEGGGSRYHSNFGLEMRGRTGRQPWAGGGEGPQYAWDCLYTVAGFTKAGSFCTFLPGASEYSFQVIGFNTSPVNHQLLEKITMGGLSSSRYAPTQSTSIVTDWWHDHKGDSTGDQFRNIRMWGEFGFGWDGSVSESGTSGSGGTNSGTKPWPMQTVNRKNNFKKITGHYEGMGGNPFIGAKGEVQIGESLADPYRWTVLMGQFTNNDNSDVYTPNGRPVYFDDNSSAASAFDKCDTLNCVRGGTNFMWLENKGIVDPFTELAMNVDVRDDTGTSNDVLNVLADPEQIDLASRNPITFFEVTIETGPGGMAGLDLKLTGEGPGPVGFDTVDTRFPMNWTGAHTIHGLVSEDTHMNILGVPALSTVSDYKFAKNWGTTGTQQIGVRVRSRCNHYKAHDTTIEDCTFEDRRKISIGTTGEGQPPFNIFLNDLTVTGIARDVVEIDPFGSGQFTEGNPVTVIANNVTNWDDGMTVDIVSGTGGDVYFSDDGGTTWYEPGYEVGGSNTTKSAPPDLFGVGLNYRSFVNTGSAAIYTPSLFGDGNNCVIVMWWDGDPGTVTAPAGYTEIAGAAANLSDNSLYVKAYEETYTTGTDCFDEAGLSGFDISSITETFSWDGGNRSGWGYSTEHTGQNATPIGNANSTPHNTAGTSHTAPTISTTTGSIIMSFIGSPADMQVSNFAGTLSPWMVRMPKDGSVWGVEGTDSLPGDSAPGTSMCAAEIYAGTGGSKAGCQYTVDASVKAITTSIEIKT